jgi:hypothetical protein
VQRRELIIAFPPEYTTNTHSPPATPPATKDLHIWLQVGAVLFFTPCFSAGDIDLLWTMLDGVRQGAGESGCTARPGDKVDMKAEERLAAGFDTV